MGSAHEPPPPKLLLIDRHKLMGVMASALRTYEVAPPSAVHRPVFPEEADTEDRAYRNVGGAHGHAEP